MKESITIYLADDHQIVIDGLTLLLKNEPRIIICGTSVSGLKAQDEILSAKPDVVLVDLRMPDKDGISLMRSLKNMVAAKWIILSMHGDRRYINDALNYGADAYLLKNTGKDELIRTIYAVLGGQKVFPEHKQSLSEQPQTFLSPRELDIFRLVINEYTSQQIAEKLSLSQYTVDTHRKNIIRKTGAKNLAGLVKYAIDHQINFND